MGAFSYSFLLYFLGDFCFCDEIIKIPLDFIVNYNVIMVSKEAME